MIRCECCSIDYPCGIHGNDLTRQQIRRAHNWPVGLPMGCKLCEHRCKLEAVVVSGRAYCLEHAREKLFSSTREEEDKDMVSVAKLFERKIKSYDGQANGEKFLLGEMNEDRRLRKRETMGT